MTKKNLKPKSHDVRWQWCFGAEKQPLYHHTARWHLLPIVFSFFCHRKTARKPYSTCESGPWLYPSPLCPALLEMTMMATVLWMKYIADIAYILHGPYAHQHSCPRHSFCCIEAILNSWIILLFLVRVAECLWFLTSTGGRIWDSPFSVKECEME